MAEKRTRIDHLTDEDVKICEVTADEWIQIGLKTGPVDKAEAEKWVKEAYRMVGEKEPEIRWVRSPFEGAKLKVELGGSWFDGLCYGQYDAHWLAFYDAFRRMGLEDETKEIVPLMELAKNCEWWWALEGLAILGERPTKISLDENNVLHCGDGPAMEWSDGSKIYVWHGTTVPEQWIMDKDSVDPSLALNHQNAEERRCLCEILGWEKVLSKLEHKTIDVNSDPEIGELFEVRLPNVNAESDRDAFSDERFLKVLCGTGRSFVIPVPPTMKTALEANAWTWNLSPNEYRPEVRT